MATSQVNNTCLIGELCCGVDCCDPAIECCGSGNTCESHPTCDECTQEVELTTCNCIDKDNGCAVHLGETPCGTGCCASGDVCVSCAGGTPNCVPI